MASKTRSQVRYVSVIKFEAFSTGDGHRGLPRCSETYELGIACLC